ncbi:Phosphoribosyl pyrophosphate synthase-associated protein 2 [Armadillidium vulgare]|nr:Phosphoribosyl pyrophosphate synthase-associated protein 2 [Armadillidium vulgare]
MVILAGNSHPELAELIANRLGNPPCNTAVYQQTNKETVVEIRDSIRNRDVFIIQTGTNKLEVTVGRAKAKSLSNRETHVEIMESVREKSVYIIQTGNPKDVNNNIMELLIMAYACKTSSARNIVGVIPYLPYCKQSKMRKRGCIVSKLLAKMMCWPYTCDYNGSASKRNSRIFDCPVDNLRASPFLLQYIQESIPDYRNAVIVAKDPGSAKKATSYAERLRLGIAVIHGEQKSLQGEEPDGRNSPPTVEHSRIMDISDGVPALTAKEKPPINVVGDVGGRIAIMVDDMIDDVASFVAAAEVLKERGAYKIYIMATHGLLSSDAPRLIENSPIDEVVVTNTVPHELQKLQCHKIKTVDISVLFTEAIRRIHNNESMSYLFRNVTLED